ncbi:histidine phosphatase family protein [Yimella sp. cx-51]|uniref:histidine phosphatase family protein n=1 Tax=Yimella sp. cx-51 TaxID=2770551 RepID=UPI00165DDC4D|nr:histidine phosphatase family protein [Yimella sp. cx-51]MBC9956870.1 histidine phosphatase family protein [Yimella sp. cx-51]QTH39096.1 histidine phosphatase family protein [Yimella sp. cx-51]
MSTPTPGASERMMRAAQPKRLIVLRHGQTTHNAGGIWQGQLDTELSPTGVEQAQKAAAALATRQPQLIWSSDLRRAAATADALARTTGVDVQHDRRLREINVGTWQGLSSQEVRERYGDELDAIAGGQDVRRGETGETLGEVRDRMLEATHELIQLLAPGALGVISTHGAAGRALAAGLAGIDPQQAWLGLAGLHNCHWVELVEGEHGWRIERWNAHA